MSQAKVLPLREPKRKEVVEDLINADTILLKMYEKEIDKIFCMDCVAECKKRDASCWYSS